MRRYGQTEGKRENRIEREERNEREEMKRREHG
jgi:hypothetical protein